MPPNRTRVFSHYLSYTVDEAFFSTLSSFEQTMIRQMTYELNNIKNTINGSDKFVSIEKMIMEGSIFKKYGEKLFPEDRHTSKKRNYIDLFHNVYKLSSNHFYIRINMLNINPIIINLYYENVIILYDLQMLTSYTKEGQLKVLSSLLESVNRYSPKDDRSRFYTKISHKYRPYKNIIPIHVNREQQEKKKMLARPITVINYVQKKNNPSNDMTNLPPVTPATTTTVTHDLQDEITTTTTPDLTVDKPILPLSPIAEETTSSNNEKFYMYGKDSTEIIELVNKKEEFEKETPELERVNKEKEYYDSLEMVVPSKEEQEEWKKANGY